MRREKPFVLQKTIANLTKNVNLPDKKCQVEADFFCFFMVFSACFRIGTVFAKSFCRRQRQEKTEKRII
jgi:hypothetical protein